MFQLERNLVLVFSESKEISYIFAVKEARRLLERLSISVSLQRMRPAKTHFSLALVRSGKETSFCGSEESRTREDGYVLKVTAHQITITARKARGILNGVYDLMERLGFLFLYPGLEGELLPAAGKNLTLPEGIFIRQPRFAYRGIYAHSLSQTNAEEWLRFFAKLRLNAVGVGEKYLSLAESLGFRCETGGHGLSELVPRKLFSSNPELFRMSQPEDFFGKRQPDYNACLTHPETAKIIRESYRKKIRRFPEIYAFHAWPEDLPGGGWCYCSRCRALSPSDQALLATRYLCEAVEKEKLALRVPMLVYHDTLPPPILLKPHPKSFLLFAPRERCYGHALSDPDCPRNTFYLDSLKSWSELYQGISDSHTFEYYLDQVLFRGMYPFLPDVILRDMKTYESLGIKSHMVLQVGGVSPAPDYNLLLFARACWQTSLTFRDFQKYLADCLFPEKPRVYQEFLQDTATSFQQAMRVCGYAPSVYFDYRWLPEATNNFAHKMPRLYQLAGEKLLQAKTKIAHLSSTRQPFLQKETARLEYEAAELKVMAWQQEASACLGHYYQTGAKQFLKKALSFFQKAIKATHSSRQKALRAKLPVDYYFYQCSRWLEKEFREKIRILRKGL